MTSGQESERILIQRDDGSVHEVNPQGLGVDPESITLALEKYGLTLVNRESFNQRSERPYPGARHPGRKNRWRNLGKGR